MPEITVLTAVRNGLKYLPATLASIQAQSFDDWELILVDDASADDTPRLIEAEMRRDARIKLIRRTRAGGPFVAAHDGLKYATGKYVARTDADDLSAPERFARQRIFLQAHPHLKACATFSQLCDDTGLLSYYYTAPRQPGSLKWYLALRCPLIHSSAFIERRTLENFYAASPALKTYLQWSDDPQAGLYTVVPDVEDYRMWCALARDGVLGVIPEILVFYRRHAGSVSRLRQGEQQALAKDVLRDHLRRLIGASWPPRKIDTLYAASHGQAISIAKGLRALKQWDLLWQGDESLTNEERAELLGMSSFRKKRFLRSCARQHPWDFIKYLNRLRRQDRMKLLEFWDYDFWRATAEHPPATLKAISV